MENPIVAGNEGFLRHHKTVLRKRGFLVPALYNAYYKVLVMTSLESQNVYKTLYDIFVRPALILPAKP
jgi:hypothetical protein